jgi:predicted porin
VVWFNTSNFLNKELGPEYLNFSTGALCLTLENIEMKKTLVAIAALAVVGAASAQVTLYGKIDATARASTTGKSGAAPVADLTKFSIDSAGLSGSRWGVKGSEDLGGGLKASFQLEQGFSVDTGNNSSNDRAFHRQAYVTLGGGFGSLSLGRQYGTIDNVMGYLDVQGYATNSAMGSAFAGGAHSDAIDGSGRVNNSIVYTSPSVSGFTGVVHYAPGEDKTATKAATAYSGFYAMYAAGPLFVMGGYEQRGSQSVTAKAAVAGSADTDGVISLGSVAVAAKAAATISGGMIGATYDLGSVKLSGAIENGKTTGASDFGYMIGAAIPMGAAALQLGWASEAQSADGMVDGTSDGLGATLVYTLSKRTNVYGSFIRSNATPAAATAAAQTKTTTTTYGVGVRHDF